MRKFIITEKVPDEDLRGEEGDEPAAAELTAVNMSIMRELEESLSTYPFDLRDFLEV